MSKIDQVHLRAVMLCMSKMGQEDTQTFMLNTILDVFDIHTLL